MNEFCYEASDELMAERKFPAVCEMCSIADVDTQANLRAAGWLLTGKTEVCGRCMAKMELYEIGQGSKRVENEYAGEPKTNGGRVVSYKEAA